MRRVAGALSALVALALVAACGDGDGNAAETTTSLVAAVTASLAGVEILSPDSNSTQVSTRPAASAYAVGTDLVVFQEADPSDGVFPPSAGGPVIAWSNGDTRELPTDPEATRVFLLDVAVIDGAPVALIAERFGEVGPDDTFEALVRIDLRDETRATIVRRPAWESGHSAARLLPDGDVIGLFASEAQVLLARWSASSTEARWTVEVGVDTSRDLTLRGGRVTLIQVAFDVTPVVTLTTIDEATGDEVDETMVDVDDPGGEIETGLFCRDWSSSSTLLCGRGGAVAVAVSVDDGTFSLLPSESGAIPTAVRSVAA